MNKKLFFNFFTNNRLNLREQMFFAKRLSVVLKAGIPLLEALRMLLGQSPSKNLAAVLGQLHKEVEKGQSLAKGLADHKKIFGEFAVNIVRVGEMSGSLNESLHYLAEEIKKKRELKNKIVGALVYPVFIVTASIGIVIVLTAYVFPKIMPVFQSFQYRLPWSTRALIFASNFFQAYWLYLVLFFLFLAIAVFYLLKQEGVRLWADKFLLRPPLLGPLFQAYQLSNFTRTAGLLLKSDVRVVECLQIASSTMGNKAYGQALALLAQTAASGQKISPAMEKHKLLFPAAVCQMVAVGEATGKLSESFLYLADMYEDELNNISKNLSSSIEPVLMIGMGLVVGFIAISIITPIYGITQSLHP